MQKIIFVLLCWPFCSYGHMVEPADSLNLDSSASPETTLATLLLAMSPIGVRVRHGNPLMVDEKVAVAEEVTEKVAAVPKVATRTAMTAPWYTKDGQREWNQIETEENTKRREAQKAGGNRGTFNRLRHGLIGWAPAYFRRGFTEAWEEGPSVSTKKKADPGDFVIPKDREPLTLFKVFQVDQDPNARDDALPWSNLGYKTAPDEEVTLSSQSVPKYWKWALPFISEEAWDGKKVYRKNTPFDHGPEMFERMLFGIELEEKKSASSQELSEVPPPWTKEGVAYVRENGIGDMVKEFLKNEPKVVPETASNVDGQWGFVKEDPLKDDMMTNTLKALSKAGAGRYSNKPPPVGSDPAEDEPFRNTLRAVSEAFAERFDLKEKPLVKTDAIVLSLYRIWERAGRRYGVDTAEFQKYIKELEDQAKATKKNQGAVAETLRGLSSTLEDAPKEEAKSASK